MPILKQLALGSSRSTRRSRLDLTAEMISAPLGDFRHTMHVGRGGDAFGDTSFLSSRSGEEPQAGESTPRSPRPGLLSRTFRSSKRSQSVTRVDRRENPLPPLGGSPTLVKNAMSLPLLSDEDGGRGRAGGVPKSLSSSSDRRPANGVATALDPEQEERNFGELTDLPAPSAPRPGAMKRTESVLSFHVDLGPSMLGDILNVMEKEEDDLGFEEGGASPTLGAREEGDEKEDEAEEEEEEEEKEEKEEVDGDSQRSPLQPPSAEEVENHSSGPCTPESQPRHPEPNHHEPDTSSISSSGSAPLEDIPPIQLQGGETDSAKLSSAKGEGETFSFMEEEDDEIRV